MAKFTDVFTKDFRDRLFLFAFLFLILLNLLGCMRDFSNMKGTIQKEDGIFVIEKDKETSFVPSSLPENFKRVGMKVIVSGSYQLGRRNSHRKIPFELKEIREEK